MKAVLAVMCGLITAFFLLGTQATKMRQTTPAQAGTQQEARRLWEQAIAAKGGRERLYSVRNMVVSHRGNLQVDLYAFPDKLWRWMDDRETPIGLAVEMHNLERNLSYFKQQNDPKPPSNQGRSGALARGRQPLIDAQLYYLLETQWVKPVPVGVTSGRVGRRTADVVQTLIDGTRVDFYLDRASHLPLKISFPAADERGTYYVTFSDYAEVAGIQMPQRVSFMGSGNLPTTYQLNVAYDEGIFERPPSVAAGAEAWRAARR